MQRRCKLTGFPCIPPSFLHHVRTMQATPVMLILVGLVSGLVRLLMCVLKFSRLALKLGIRLSLGQKGSKDSGKFKWRQKFSPPLKPASGCQRMVTSDW